MLNLIENKKFVLKTYNKYIRFNGDKLKNFYRHKPENNIECYAKMLNMFADWAFSGDNKDKEDKDKSPFYFSTKRILEVLNTKKNIKENGYKDELDMNASGFGNDYCDKTIRRGYKTLEALELITIEYRKSKAERMAEAASKGLEFDPDEFVPYRTIKLNYEAVRELYNVYDVNDPYLTDYATTIALKQAEALVEKKMIAEEDAGQYVIDKTELYLLQLRKIVQKRPYSYVEKINDKYTEYKEKGLVKGKYNNANEMFIYYINTYCRKYSNVNNFFNKYLPTYLQNAQKVADKEYMKNASPYGELTKEDLERIRKMTPSEAKSYVDKLKGYYVSDELWKTAEKLHIRISDNRVIDYNNINEGWNW